MNKDLGLPLQGALAWQIPNRTPLQQWIARWIEWLRASGFADTTTLNRKTAVRRLVEYADVSGLTETSQFTQAQAMAFRRWLMGRSQAESTLCQNLTGVRLFCRWCARQGLMESEPFEELRIRGFHRPLPQGILRPEEVERILAVPDVESPKGLRDRAILEALYSTGIRRSEIVKIKLIDIHWERGLLFIRQGKGKKDRYVPVGSRALEWMRAYIDRVRVHLAKVEDEGFLWLAVTGDDYSHISLGKMVKEAFLKAGIDRKGVACHMMRHTCATLLMENGADIRAVQDILGHKNLESTQIYTHVSQTRAKEVHTRCHPAERQILTRNQ